MENMERFTLSYAIMNSMENLRFGKDDYFHVLVFYTGYFIKEIENIWKFELWTLVKVSTSISRSPKLPLVFL